MEAQSSTALMTRRERREAALRSAQDVAPTTPHPSGPLPVVVPPLRAAPQSRRERREAALVLTGELADAGAETRLEPHPSGPLPVVADSPSDLWQTSVRLVAPGATPSASPHRSVVRPGARRPAVEAPAGRPVRARQEPAHDVAALDRTQVALPRVVRAPVSAAPSGSHPQVVPASVPVPVVAAPSVVGPACDEHTAVQAPDSTYRPDLDWHADVAARWERPAGQSVPAPTAPAARRDGGAGSAPRRQNATERPRWVPRAAVLTSLAVATIAVPLTGAAHNLDDRDGVGGGTGPSLLDAVSAKATDGAAPASIKALAATSSHDDTAASRSDDRTGLKGCDSTGYVKGQNGLLDTDDLCELWQKNYFLQPAAAQALSALNDAFKVRFGQNICLVAAYRPLAEQYTLATTRAGYAATPGTSDHGLGIAIDFCSSMTGNAEIYQWLRSNAPIYGWENPPWARAGGVGAYEPWHFEYYPGIKPMGGSV